MNKMKEAGKKEFWELGTPLPKYEWGQSLLWGSK